MIEKPDAIMMNIPKDFFKDNLTTAEKFVKYYDSCSKSDEEWCFYHFISSVPVHEVLNCYLCFDGKVQMKVNIVKFLKMQPVDIPGYSHPTPRNWMIATGPVIKSPKIIPQKGFRGFRYTQHLF